MPVNSVSIPTGLLFLFRRETKDSAEINIQVSIPTGLLFLFRHFHDQEPRVFLCFNPYRASFPLPTFKVITAVKTYNPDVSIPTGLLFLFRHNRPLVFPKRKLRFNPYRASFPLPTLVQYQQQQLFFVSIPPGLLFLFRRLEYQSRLLQRRVSIPTGLLFLFRRIVWRKDGSRFYRQFQSLPGFFSSSDFF